MTPSPARIAEAAEAVCARLGLGADAARAVALAVEIAALSPQPPTVAGLTRTESRLARVLAAAAGRTLRADALIEAAAIGDDNTLKVMICRLRRKRPDIGRALSTVWGIGYRWEGAAPDGADARP